MKTKAIFFKKEEDCFATRRLSRIFLFVHDVIFVSLGALAVYHWTRNELER